MLKDRIGGQHAINDHPRFDDYHGMRVLTVECDRSKAPVFVKDGQAERFYVRYGPSTTELMGNTAQEYIKQSLRDRDRGQYRLHDNPGGN